VAETDSYIITTGAPHRSKLEDFGGRQFLDQNDRDGPSFPCHSTTWSSR